MFGPREAKDRCTILEAWGWCTGTTRGDGMGRKEGGGFRMGNTCIPVAKELMLLNCGVGEDS